MNVLVCGARGFVGRATAEALRRRGHRVVEGVSSHRRHEGGGAVVRMDFARDIEAATWLPRLVGIDAVVNAVGVLRDSPGRPIEAVHDRVPGALFDACAQSGVRRVVHVSALGIDGSRTAYARTKRAAEERLAAGTRAGRLDGVVVRPSIVFGAGGASSRLFLRLARLPALALPRLVHRALVQPIAVEELALGIAVLVDGTIDALGADRPDPLDALDGPDTRERAAGAERRASAPTIAAVGPAPIALAAFIASLRAQAGRAPRAGLHAARSPDLLERPRGRRVAVLAVVQRNAGPAGPRQRGVAAHVRTPARPARDPLRRLVEGDARMTAPTSPTTLTLGTRDARLLRASLVIVWLATALASALEAHGQSAALLAQAGLRSPALVAAVL